VSMIEQSRSTARRMTRFEYGTTQTNGHESATCPITDDPDLRPRESHVSTIGRSRSTIWREPRVQDRTAHTEKIYGLDSATCQRPDGI
jgi:hypothetical protein